MPAQGHYSTAELATYLDVPTAPRPALTQTLSQAEWVPWIEADAAIRELDAQIASLADKLTHVEDGLRAWLPLRDQNARVPQICTRLAELKDQQKTLEVTLRVKRATLLAQTGRDLEARADHLKVLELDPPHLANLVGLGRLLSSTGYRKAAQTVYTKALDHHPNDIVCRVNLGALLIEDDPAAARDQYEAALRIDPDFLQAHGGLYYALARLGETESAEMHRRKCFGRQSIFPVAYRGNAQPVSVLLFVSSRGGNAPIERFLNDRIFEAHVIVTDFFDTSVSLPPHQLAINAIGDIDVAGDDLACAESLLAATSAPVINSPAAIRATSRCDITRRLSRVPGVITPQTITLSREALADFAAPSALDRRGFRFPLLLRTPGFHGGENFLRVEYPSELRDAVANLPGRELTVIEYLDARGQDGKTRKYRAMMVDRRIYPLHLAISRNWKVHYFSAEMADVPEHRAEDAAFLSDMSGVLGPRAMAALTEIQSLLALDYGGIDFALSATGEVLLFEANATMGVLPPEADPRWDYRRPAVDRIYSAVAKMLVERAQPHLASATTSR